MRNMNRFSVKSGLWVWLVINATIHSACCDTWPGPVHVSVHRKQTNLRLRCLRQAHFHGLIIAMMFCLLGMIHIKVDNPSWKSVGESEFLIAENLNINSVFFIYQILGNVGCQLLVIHGIAQKQKCGACPKKEAENCGASAEFGAGEKVEPLYFTWTLHWGFHPDRTEFHKAELESAMK